MKYQLIFIALYRALNCLYDEAPNERLRVYLSDANPYIYADRTSADPAVYSDFCEFLDKQFHKEDYPIEESYSIVKSYLESDYLSYYGNFVKTFEDISLEEWNDLCGIVIEEEV